jgi:UDP-GlcNAc:undecaprenyl-phosphate GlcNAc-1-phosphate transferase
MLKAQLGFNRMELFAAPFRQILPRRIFWLVATMVSCLLVIPHVSQLFFELGKRWLYILLLSCCLAGTLTPLIMWLAVRLDIVDIPGGRKIHDKKTPLLGGLSIIFAFNAALFANMILDQQMLVLLAGGTVVAIMSVIDDWRDISARWKLLVQLVVVAFLIRHGIILDLFPNETIWGFGLDAMLTVLWIVGITNSMNFIDGMDGLAAGVAAIISLFLGIVAYQTGQPTMGWVAIAMLGSCMGFLPYNFGMKREAGIFLGDTGSTFIGFILASIAVKGEWAASGNEIVSFSAPVLIFWVLIFDMTYITVERIMTGKVRTFREWIDYVGKDHLHHRLYELLRDKRKVVLFIYVLCATLGISALALRHAGTFDSILLVGQAFLITVIISIIEYSGRRHH